MTGERFDGELEAARGGGAFVALPDDVLGGLGGGSRFRVTGTLNGLAFASSTMSFGDGRVCLGVHKATRLAAGVVIGDVVKIEIELDTRARELHLPETLATALAEDPVASAAFDRLSFTQRREYAESLSSAKRDETRERRLAQILDRLRT